MCPKSSHRQNRPTYQGKSTGDILSKLASFHGKSNVCRNLHNLIHKTEGLTLPIEVDAVKIQVKKKKPVRVLEVFWPVLRIKSWIGYFLKYQPEVLLGGCRVESGAWKPMFESFWAHYRKMDPMHEVFTSGLCLQNVIPFSVHGDEGRGLARKPLMVLAWQLIIGHRGPGSCNDSTFFAHNWEHCVFVVFHQGSPGKIYRIIDFGSKAQLHNTVLVFLHFFQPLL